MKTQKLRVTLIALAILASCTKKSNEEEIIIGLNEGIHHDDFEYAVTDYKIQKTIGEGEDAFAAKGNFYIVSFKVENDARCVKHEWDNTIAYLIDDSGKVYNNDNTAQAALEKVNPFGLRSKYTTEHQTSQETKLVFDLPENVKQPYLMVRGETLMGDFFGGDKFTRTKVKLF
jgi:hypothetical protein